MIGHLVVVSAGLAFSGAPETDAAALARWGDEALGALRADLYLPDRRLYADGWSEEDGPSGPAFMWGCGVALSALNAAAASDPSWRPALREYVDALDVYWNAAGPVPGYDVLPCPKPVDRYYDDNEWMVLALLETHSILGDPADLDRAERTMAFVLSGRDERLGDGVYWRESDKASKNACSNAPAALAAYRLHQRTAKPEHLDAANALIDWTLANLCDPEDGLIWDNMRLDGSIEKTKWSYNAALTLHALAARSETEEPDQAVRSLGLAEKMARAAVERWRDPETGAFRDGAAFAHLLAEALLAVDKRTGEGEFTPVVLEALAALHRDARDANGRYPEHWDTRTDEPLAKVRLIDQASAARAFLHAAAALGNVETSLEG